MIRYYRLLFLSIYTVICLPFLQAQVSINEVLADNASSISDESGDFEDWIELYNGTNQPVDIGGYYISDDPAVPLLWQIPTNASSETTIAAGGFLILWADKDVADGPLHIDLKLGAGGESLSLYASDGTTVVDLFDFGSQSEDISYGRSTDGGSDFQIFTNPTPGISNETSSPIPTYTVTINSVVENVEDDAIEYGVSNQSMELSNYGMKMTQSWSNQKIGVRFKELQIPEGATITNATIQFTTRKVTTGTCELNIQGHRTGNASAFNNSSGNISNRQLTQSEVTWEPEDWLIADFEGPEQETPNLAPVIQEIIDQPNWNQGNAIAFIITGTGVRSSHNFTSGFAPSISIEMEVPIPTTPISNLFINEIAANGTDFMADNGKFTDWIEIYNANNFDVSVGGLYLSDDPDDLAKWQIATNEVVPANGHLLFFADDKTEAGGRHSNFKLSDDGETVSLAQVINNEFIVIDSISYGVVPFKSTVGRPTDGASGWELFGQPTPEAANDASIDWLEPVTIDLDNGVYSTTQSVTISHVDSNVDIYYTTDGTLPDDNQQLYTGPISVSSTQSVRAIATKSGHAPSRVTTRSYLFDASPDLPVLMITTDPDNLFDDEIGIYTVGTNGIQVGNCSNNFPANFWQDWERPANLTFFETDGDAAFSVDAGMKISGNCSRRYELKSLNFYLRNNQYGSNNIDYKLFPNRDFKKYDRLRLRSSGQDYRSTMMRDGTNQRMLAEVTEVEYQNYRPTLVYINGEYWGIQNFRDLYGGEYFDAHFDVKEDELDMIKSPRNANVIKEGDDIHYQNLYNYVESNDMSDRSNYEYFQTQFDIESFLDYWISMVYMASSDWPANNLQVWRERKATGKWRYMYLDTDATTSIYGFNSTNGFQWNTLDEVTNPNQQGWPFDQRATLFLRKLMMNEDFKNEYIQRSCSFMELILNAERAHQFIDASAAEINSEIGRHVEKYAYDNPYLENYSDWSSNINNFKTFFDERPAYYYNHMESFFDINGRYDLNFNYDANTNGKVFLHTKKMEIPFGYTGSYYDNIPIRITAEAADGYEFVEWLETGETDATIFLNRSSNFTLTPIFQAMSGVCDPNSPDFEDDDNDGVCNDDDLCPGFDDNIDVNNNGIPDDCESCPDEDGDGVCNDDDLCPGFDDNIDVNNNGIPDDCEQPCTDVDGDGVCEADDCDDNNPNLPADVGSSCDDGNPATDNDVYLADGCTCQGTIIPTQGYCENEGDFPWHEWIAGVQLNQIDNSSSKRPYTDFTNIVTSLEIGGTYDITLTTEYSWTTFDEYFRVWIDYNSDQIFTTDEIAFSGIVTAPPNGTEFASVSGSLSVPSNLTDGVATRMRVAMQRGSYPEPCALIPFGEVEDYTVVFADGILDRKTADIQIPVWPVPARDIVNIKMPEDVNVNRISVLYGQGKEKIRFTSLPDPGEIFTLDVIDWEDGLYFIQMEVANSKWRYAKIIVGGNY